MTNAKRVGSMASWRWARRRTPFVRRCRIGSLVLALGALVVGTGVAAAAKKTVVGVININDAPAAVLQLLPGIGPAKAERIIAYRERHRFGTVEELGRVKGIGPKTVRKLRLYLAVRGPTTANAPPVGLPAPSVPATGLPAPSAPATTSSPASSAKPGPPRAVVALPGEARPVGVKDRSRPATP